MLLLHGCETSPFSFPWPEISQRVPESKSDPVCLKLEKENSARQRSLKSHNKRLEVKKTEGRRSTRQEATSDVVTACLGCRDGMCRCVVLHTKMDERDSLRLLRTGRRWAVLVVVTLVCFSHCQSMDHRKCTPKRAPATHTHTHSFEFGGLHATESAARARHRAAHLAHN